MTIDDLFELAVNNVSNKHYIIDLETISDTLVERIRLEIGIDITGFVISIDNYGIRHTLERHGDLVLENSQGQKAIEKKDFQLIQIIVNEADKIIYDPRRKSPNSPLIETFIFEKQIDDFYYVLKELRRVTKKGKVNRLVLQTMYITKKRRTF